MYFSYKQAKCGAQIQNLGGPWGVPPNYRCLDEGSTFRWCPVSAPSYDRTRVPKGWISLKAIRKDGVSTDVLFEETKIKSPNYCRCGRL